MHVISTPLPQKLLKERSLCAFLILHCTSAAYDDFLVALEATFPEMSQSPLLLAQNKSLVLVVHTDPKQHEHEVPYTIGPYTLPAKQL